MSYQETTGMQCISRITCIFADEPPTTCSVRKTAAVKKCTFLLLARNDPLELCAHTSLANPQEEPLLFSRLVLPSIYFCVRATGHFRGFASFKTRATDNSKNNYVLFTHQ